MDDFVNPDKSAAPAPRASNGIEVRALLLQEERTGKYFWAVVVDGGGGCDGLMSSAPRQLRRCQGRRVSDRAASRRHHGLPREGAAMSSRVTDSFDAPRPGNGHDHDRAASRAGRAAYFNGKVSQL